MADTGPHLWAFDIGTGSFGIAVRKGSKMVHVASLLVPSEFASIDEARIRRRSSRTREAHKAREEWLRECFVRAGLSEAILTGRRAVKLDGRWQTVPGDYRLEREFPPVAGRKTSDGAPSDETGSRICYCGAILRIRLLRREPLEPWQIFKALHSAMQKRGYDPSVPWKAQDRSRASSPGSRTGEARRQGCLRRSPDHVPRAGPGPGAPGDRPFGG